MRTRNGCWFQEGQRIAEGLLLVMIAPIRFLKICLMSALAGCGPAGPLDTQGALDSTQNPTSLGVGGIPDLISEVP